MKNIEKRFGKVTVVHDLSFILEENRTLSVLGKSGCGKTTLLKILAGLIEPDRGTINLRGKDISERPPQKRNTVYLYQEDLLFPHLSLFENIAFGLKVQKADHADIEHRVHAMIKSLELSGMEDRMPQELSGGQRQRVSFGRAIITNPTLLLLDEPFGSLDAITRKSMQTLCKNLTKRYNITSIFVTHDLKEALIMGDRFAIMHQGRLRVFDTQEDFASDPESGVAAEVSYWSQVFNQKRESKND